MRNIILILILLIAISCSKDSEQIENKSDHSVIGTWIHSSFNEDIRVLYRNNEFIDNYGVKFIENYELIEKRNSGFCGTPPISYAEFKGKWNEISEQIIEINIDFWEENLTYQIEIVSLTADTLKIKYIRY